MTGAVADNGDLALRAVVLASASPTRARLLSAAGIACAIDPARIDEAAIKAELDADGAIPERIATALAEAKAALVSARHTGRLVIGADQVLDFDGCCFDKPLDRAAAAAQLRRLRGGCHRQVSAVAALRDGALLWSHIGITRLWVREFSEPFLERYLDMAGDAALSAPGGYRLEEHGAHLFARIEGDHFTVLGLPLLALLEYLRADGALMA
jgi:nucleoside triphosphate pyrophosphatase